MSGLKPGKYLGETVLESYDGTPYEGYTPSDWALEYINSYGGIDGDHHKMWVIDQICRILKGTPIELKLAKWENHEEYRFSTLEPSQKYLDWVQKTVESGYSVDEGCPP